MHLLLVWRQPGCHPQLRKRAIFIGMAMAAGLRICFAIVASQLMAVQGILIIGGALLAWVCWRFYKDLKEFNAGTVETMEPGADGEVAGIDNSGKQTKFSRALLPFC